MVGDGMIGGGGVVDKGLVQCQSDNISGVTEDDMKCHGKTHVTEKLTSFKS